MVPSKVLDHSTGAQVPLVAMGMVFRKGASSAEVVRALTTWISLGGRHIDAADLYGNQADLGRAIEEVKKEGVGRDQLFITSKVPGPIGYGRTRSLVLDDMLPKLRSSYVDLLLVHWPCTADPFKSCDGSDGLSERVDTWRALEELSASCRFSKELRAEGKVRSIGVSNFGVRHLEPFFDAVRRDLGGPPNVTANQVSWNFHDHDAGLLSWCTQNHITLEAYGALGGEADAVAAALQTPAVVSIAEAQGVKPAQVIFRWVVQRGIVLVTNSDSPTHMAEDLDPLFAFNLTEADMNILDNVSS